MQVNVGHTQAEAQQLKQQKWQALLTRSRRILSEYIIMQAVMQAFRQTHHTSKRTGIWANEQANTQTCGQGKQVGLLTSLLIIFIINYYYYY